jgi:hypothetical protein
MEAGIGLEPGLRRWDVLVRMQWRRPRLTKR